MHAFVAIYAQTFPCYNISVCMIIITYIYQILTLLEDSVWEKTRGLFQRYPLRRPPFPPPQLGNKPLD